MPEQKEQVLYEAPTENGRELIRATVSTFKGKVYVAVRRWWRENEDDEWKPGKGISVAQGPDVRSLLQALEAVKKWAETP